MNDSNKNTSIDKSGMSLRLGVLLPYHEYLLAMSAIIIALIAIVGR